MLFIGYTTKGNIESLDIIDLYENNYVIKDNETVILAIDIKPSKDSHRVYAMFKWDDFNGSNMVEMHRIIKMKVDETISFFSETIGLINNNFPTLIYQDVLNILKHNNGNISISELDSAKVLTKEYNIPITIEHEISNSNWHVIVGNFVTYTVDNEYAAQRIYQLIVKDLANFIHFRWSTIKL